MSSVRSRKLLRLSQLVSGTRAHPDRPCGDADSIAKEQLASVRERIASLRKLEAELERIATCCTGETVGDCYVIRALSDHGLCDNEH